MAQSYRAISWSTIVDDYYRTFGATHNLSWGHWRGPQPPGRRPKSAAGSSISGWPPTAFDDGEATLVTTALLAAGALVAGPAGHGQRVTERPEIR
jgi:hypothetical protein